MWWKSGVKNMSREKVATTTLNVLILEDSATQARFIARMFQDAGARTEIILSANQFATDVLLIDETFHAALIDVNFGKVSGLTLIDPFLQRWPMAAVGMITANGKDDFSVLGEARSQGAHFVLPKPFSKSDVESLLVDIDLFRRTREMRKHVVVIDDSIMSCKIASTLLRAAGYRVSTFQDGLEAICKISYDKVDVVLTDMNMPGMTGQELICLVRDVWANVAIIAMSGDPKLASKAGADVFIPKPFGPEELIRVTRQALSEKEFQLEC